jgi:hypothetical protein
LLSMLHGKFRKNIRIFLQNALTYNCAKRAWRAGGGGPQKLDNVLSSESIHKERIRP